MFHIEGSIPHYNGYFGQGTGPVLLSDVGCSGSEDNILECSHNKQNALTYCSAYDSAGVTCIGKGLAVKLQIIKTELLSTFTLDFMQSLVKITASD